MHKEKLILVFVRYPEPGKVKTNLSSEIGEEKAAELYKVFTEDLITRLSASPWQFKVCYSPEKAEEEYREWLGSDLEYFPQEGNNLGERIINGFKFSFSEGFKKVLLLRGDSPDIPVRVFNVAYYKLQDNDLIIGPSSGGGYYIIGFNDNGFNHSIFYDIEWGSKNVYSDTRSLIESENISFEEISPWYDLESLKDLEQMINVNRGTEFQNLKTFNAVKSLLKEHGIE